MDMFIKNIWYVAAWDIEVEGSAPIGRIVAGNLSFFGGMKRANTSLARPLPASPCTAFHGARRGQ